MTQTALKCRMQGMAIQLMGLQTRSPHAGILSECVTASQLWSLGQLLNQPGQSVPTPVQLS